MKVHLYHGFTGKHTLTEIKNVLQTDAEFFERNNIKVSMEELRGDFIVYGCPYDDESEESEVIVFANGRTCEETLNDLAVECAESFGII